MKRPGWLPSFLLLAAFAAASPAVAANRSPRARYRIELSDGSQWTVVGAPVVHGTVVTFRTPNGTLMGVPREMIRRLASVGSADVAAPVIRSLEAAPATVEEAGVEATMLETVPAETLRPGDLVVLGPLTEVGPTLAESARTGAAGPGNGAMATGGVAPASPGSSGYGGGLNPNVINPSIYVNPNGIVLPRAPSTTDLAIAQAAQTQVGANGFPVMSNGAPTAIGPDGTPTLAPGVPGSSTPAIGPDGTPIIGETGPPPSIGPNGAPVLAPTGQPGSEQPLIGPNGTPVLAPSGQPGSTPVVIGPNGTPELAPSVATGSTPVVIGPNGTPVLAPTGQPGAAMAVIGPNGTPVLAPNGQAGSAFVVIGPNGTPAAVSAPSRASGVRSGGGARR